MIDACDGHAIVPSDSFDVTGPTTGHVHDDPVGTKCFSSVARFIHLDTTRSGPNDIHIAIDVNAGNGTFHRIVVVHAVTTLV